ncbi:MAG: OsmC family protein [Flavobacteriaceae bacterium]
MKNVKSTTVLSRNNYRAKALSGEHVLHMDRPIVDNGDNSSATPIQYLLAAIGGCVSMTLRVFANNKGWDLGEITVEVFQKTTLTSSGLETTLFEEISFEKKISPEQNKELLIIAGKCPVVKLLKSETNIESKII